MLKMLMDPMGGIVMTNDGNAILREVSANRGHKSEPTIIYGSEAVTSDVYHNPRSCHDNNISWFVYYPLNFRLN